MPRSPQIAEYAVGTSYWRICRAGASRVIWFGPAPGSPPTNRFDAPNGEYRVCYVGATREGAFAEVFLRNPPVEIISEAEVEARRIAEIAVLRPIRVAKLHGPGLAQAGVTGTVTTGADYLASQAAALAMWTGYPWLDGIEYRARHDDDELSVALFDRASAAIEERPRMRLTDDRAWYAGLPGLYGFEFNPGAA
jgi:hypothetical protein